MTLRVLWLDLLRYVCYLNPYISAEFSTFGETPNGGLQTYRYENERSQKEEHTRVEANSYPQRDFASDYASIPPHGRWQHFNVGSLDRITHLLQSWPSTIDTQERTRRLLDLFLVSVLLDAGAGTAWSYKSKVNGKVYKRSEGLAVASLEMFKAGFFSSDEEQPFQVDAEGLAKLTPEMVGKGLQVSESNPLAGLEGRSGLLIRLSEALRNEKYFGAEQRPGNMLGKFPFHRNALPLIRTREHSSSRAVWLDGKANDNRLPYLPPHNPSLIRPHRSRPNPLARPHGRFGSYLAC